MVEVPDQLTRSCIVFSGALQLLNDLFEIHPKLYFGALIAHISDEQTHLTPDLQDRGVFTVFLRGLLEGSSCDMPDNRFFQVIRIPDDQLYIVTPLTP